ncbi:hypothetical protein HMPREF1985_01394 [Mitsuokella sp. oral taxon 131 str. W9106]|nr:hypothetical protein HMPREF1985_01394 [Mitsuokella sp. oral taxon 131 str. W9106]
MVPSFSARWLLPPSILPFAVPGEKEQRSNRFSGKGACKQRHVPKNKRKIERIGKDIPRETVWGRLSGFVFLRKPQAA